MKCRIIALYKFIYIVTADTIVVKYPESENKDLHLIENRLERNITQKNGYNRIEQQSNTIEKCFVITSNALTNSSSILDDLKQLPSKIKYIYKKHITGFTFCTDNKETIKRIKEKSSILNIEEDQLFRIGSVNNDKKYFGNIYSDHRNNRSKRDGYQDKEISPIKKSEREPERRILLRKQTVIPLYFYRMMNLGNLIFNNYLLDNIIFRIFGINHLIKYIYSYRYYYSGKGVQITSIDSECNSQSDNIVRLLTGPSAIAKNASVVVIDDVECDGSIWLSKLLYSLEKIESTNILFLPLSGPHSNTLNSVLNKLSNKSIIVAAAGNEKSLSCGYSPSGFSVIKVGSVNKHGSISNFSNKGECNKLYTLGENINDDSGTSYSAAIVASAVAIYLEKQPDASFHSVLRFLINNSTNNNDLYYILKLPVLVPGNEKIRHIRYYTTSEVVGCFILLLCLKLSLFYLIIILYRRYRIRRAEEVFVLEPLN